MRSSSLRAPWLAQHTADWSRTSCCMHQAQWPHLLSWHAHPDALFAAHGCPSTGLQLPRLLPISAPDDLLLLLLLSAWLEICSAQPCHSVTHVTSWHVPCCHRIRPCICHLHPAAPRHICHAHRQQPRRLPLQASLQQLLLPQQQLLRVVGQQEAVAASCWCCWCCWRVALCELRAQCHQASCKTWVHKRRWLAATSPCHPCPRGTTLSRGTSSTRRHLLWCRYCHRGHRQQVTQPRQV
jgi:hypothetical protein